MGNRTERQALQRVQSAASDYFLGVKNEGFAEFCGGLDKLMEVLKQASDYYEEQFNTLGEHEDG